ncbi:MAG: CysS/YqeB C-terminal domain-containing protein [Acidimicrobiales bacterium]
MAPPLPRLLAIMGSGETAPTMSKVHRSLLARLGPPPVPAVLLDTPFGFQGNADELASRAVAYFRESVQADIAVASFRSGPETGSVGYETMLNRVREARYVFAGPGSPSYALSHWRGTQVPVVLADKLATGGCVTFASAAAVTLGPFALPVYEVYKVGQAPHWLEGLDLMGAVGLPAVVIPHFDNAEGGTHDTRYCYMGEVRLRLLEDMLADELFVLGVDEHTACILDLDGQTATVAGRGRVTVRRRGRMAHLASGDTVALAALAGLADDSVGVGDLRGAAASGAGRSQPGPIAAAGVAPLVVGASLFLEELAGLRSEFDAALAGGDPLGAVKAALTLDNLVVEWSRDTLQSDELDTARSALRSMIVRLGEAAEQGLRDPREVVGPFVETVLAARARARDDKRWAEADILRDRLVEIGVEVHDTSGATSWELR